MIKRIAIPSIAPFTTGASEIAHLSRVNFLFGANGTGKTTISNLICDESVNPDSEALEWESDSPVKTYVYNRNFVSANFDGGRNINGIFTMGEDSVETQKKIDELTKAIEKHKFLVGGDKSTQDRDVRKARELAKEWRREHENQ